MNTETTTLLPDSIPADEDADNQAIVEMLATGRPIDPETDRRIGERASRITEELRRQFGIREVAVELVRASRVEA